MKTRPGIARFLHRGIQRGLAGCALLLLTSVGGAIPDAVGGDSSYKRLERRLKSASVDSDLARKITQAVGRGVTHLLATQHAGGGWSRPSGPRLTGLDEADGRGVTVLCALALQHSEIVAAKPALKKALRLVSDEDSYHGRGVRRVYVDGMLALLLFGERRDAMESERVARRLSASQDLVTSWWGYAAGTPVANLSTSQFAALGLWASGLSGHPASWAVWGKHLDAILSYQTSSGSWPYWPKAKSDGYATGTFMGQANLLLAQAALAARRPPGRALAKRVRRAVHLGRKAVIRDGVRVLKDPTGDHGCPDALWLGKQAWNPYYRLYALEKACIFSGVERLGKHPWYAEGARFLLSVQRLDGSWGAIPRRWPKTKVKVHETGDSISTSFALLFLLRSSEVVRPRAAPRQLGPSPTVVTGGK